MKWLNIHKQRERQRDNHMHTLSTNSSIYFSVCHESYRHRATSCRVITPPQPLTSSLCFSFSWSLLFSASLPLPPIISSFCSSVSLSTHLENTAITEVIVSEWMVITFGIKGTSEHCLEQQQPCPLAVCLLWPFELVEVEFKYKVALSNGSRA